MSEDTSMFYAKRKSLKRAAMFRPVVATFLAVAMFVLMHLFEVADALSGALPNMDHGGGLLVVPVTRA